MSDFLEPRKGLRVLVMGFNKPGYQDRCVEERSHEAGPRTVPRRSSRCARIAASRSPVARPRNTIIPSFSTTPGNSSNLWSLMLSPVSSISTLLPGTRPWRSRIFFGKTIRPKRSIAAFMATLIANILAQLPIVNAKVLRGQGTQVFQVVPCRPQSDFQVGDDFRAELGTEGLAPHVFDEWGFDRYFRI
jgi:hypothetical protein